jgi:murein DD-endopeptidase MepM/ murein hydrolase activator NlpD
MKGKKHRAILIFPPGSGKMRTFHVPKSFIIFFSILICLGFAGYFIPFNNFSLDVIEKNQKRNLDDQNIRMMQAIRPMRRFLDNLGDEIEKLERKKQKVARVLGLTEAQGRDVNHLKTAKTSLLSLDDLKTVVSKNYDLFSKVTEANIQNQEKAYFDVIPVIMPVFDKPLISNRFGKERDPFTQYSKMHYGIDLIVSRGSPVVATASGVVSKVEDGRVWGRRIFITNSYGFSTVYAHLGTVEVFAGKKVKKGDRIATVGLSGLTTGMHVHYEVWRNGKPENPEEYFFPQTMQSNPQGG